MVESKRKGRVRVAAGSLRVLLPRGCTREERVGPAVFAAAEHSFAPPEFPARTHGNDPAGAK